MPPIDRSTVRLFKFNVMAAFIDLPALIQRAADAAASVLDVLSYRPISALSGEDVAALTQLRAVNRQIDDALQVLDHEATASNSPRLQLDQQSQSVVVDGERYVIKRPQAFAAFAAIVNAKGLVKSRDLHALPSCKVRLDRLFNRWLPVEIRKLIASSGGHGGGYWLSLPPQEKSTKSRQEAVKGRRGSLRRSRTIPKRRK
jgi:hypothetical protein